MQYVNKSFFNYNSVLTRKIPYALRYTLYFYLLKLLSLYTLCSTIYSVRYTYFVEPFFKVQNVATDETWISICRSRKYTQVENLLLIATVLGQGS